MTLHIGTYRAPWGETYTDTFVEFGQYPNGETAFTLIGTDEYGMPDVLSAPTVNLSTYGLRAGDQTVWLDNYSEHEGMIASLVEYGIITEVISAEQVGPHGAKVVLAELSAKSLEARQNDITTNSPLI